MIVRTNPTRSLLDLAVVDAIEGRASPRTRRGLTKPAVWDRPIEILDGPVLDEDCTFIHRDLYPGNGPIGRLR